MELRALAGCASSCLLNSFEEGDGMYIYEFEIIGTLDAPEMIFLRFFDLCDVHPRRQ